MNLIWKDASSYDATDMGVATVSLLGGAGAGLAVSAATAQTGYDSLTDANRCLASSGIGCLELIASATTLASASFVVAAALTF